MSDCQSFPIIERGPFVRIVLVEGVSCSLVLLRALPYILSSTHITTSNERKKAIAHCGMACLLRIRIERVTDPIWIARLLEGTDGAGFVVVDVEDGVELGQLQHIVHLFGEAEQFEACALVLDRGVGADQLAQA